MCSKSLLTRQKEKTMTNEVTARKLINSLNKNAADRIAYEESKAAHTCVDKLIKYASLDHSTNKTKLNEAFFENVVKADFLQNFDFINNHVKENQRFNIYAVQKAFAKIKAVSADKLVAADSLANKFCVASVLTCLQNRDKEQFSFTRQHALAMLSNALKFENVARSDFSSKFNVSAATAATQVSSSFRTLEALNILEFDESARDRSIVKNVNYDNAFVKIVQAHFDIK